MLAHLWTKKPAPAAYIELVLCRDVYHCTPNELEKVPPEKILQALTILAAEAQVQDARANRHTKKASKKTVTDGS